MYATHIAYYNYSTMNWKNLLAIAGLSLLALGTQAQTEAQEEEKGEVKKGTLVFTGNLSYSYSREAPEQDVLTREVRSLQPRVGYTIMPNLVVGGILDMSQTLSTSKLSSLLSENKIDRPSLGGGIFARYYNFISDDVALFGELTAWYNSAAVTTTTVNSFANPPTTNVTKAREFGYTFRITPGIAYFPSSRWSIEFAAGLAGYTDNTAITDPDPVNNNPSTTNKSSRWDLGLNPLQITTGVTFYLAR